MLKITKPNTREYSTRIRLSYPFEILAISHDNIMQTFQTCRYVDLSVCRYVGRYIDMLHYICIRTVIIRKC